MQKRLVIARQQSPDLVLLDINLPGMDGISALRLFKKRVQLACHLPSTAASVMWMK
jgi:CheY-like chemotaxis protein